MEKWLVEKVDGLKEYLASAEDKEEVKAVEDKAEEAKEEL